MLNRTVFFIVGASSQGFVWDLISAIFAFVLGLMFSNLGDLAYLILYALLLIGEAYGLLYLVDLIWGTQIPSEIYWGILVTAITQLLFMIVAIFLI